MLRVEWYYEPTFKLKSKYLWDFMGDEDLYLRATKEVENETKDEALWAKAMAICEGETKKAKYEYIKLRVLSFKGNDESEITHNEYIDLVSIQSKRDKIEKDLGVKEKTTQKEKKYREGSDKFKGMLLVFAVLFPISVIFFPISVVIGIGNLTLEINDYNSNTEIKFIVDEHSRNLLIFTAIITLWQIYLLFIFYSKKYTFPGLYCLTFIISNVISLILNHIFIKKLSDYYNIEVWPSIFKLYLEPMVLISLAIPLFWVSYFFISNNSKSVFQNK